MSDPFDLSVAITVWRKHVAWFWDDAVARLPLRLRQVAEGRPGEGAAAMHHELAMFTLAQPAAVAAQFGVLAPTLDAAVADKQARAGADGPVGIYEVSMASVGNIFECLGLPIAATTWDTVRGWLPRLEVSRNDERVSYFWTTGLIAMVLGDRATGRRIAGHSGDGPIPFVPGATFQMNLRGFLHHLAGAVEAGAGADDVMPGFNEVLANYQRFSEGKALSEGTLLWIARIVHHQLGKQPLGTTAQFLHDTIWALAGEPNG
jgi:hypothetical protein